MPSSCVSPARGLFVLCLISVCWSFSFGLGAPLASLWLEDAGNSDTLIGLNTGFYYLGIALAAPLVPWLMRRCGRGCIGLGMLVSGLAVAAFPWVDATWAWFALRSLNGVAGALSLIPLETLVNQNSPPKQRSRDFGFYAFSVALGMALGNWIGLQLYTDVPKVAFLVGGLVPLAGSVLLRWLPWSQPVEEVADAERQSRVSTFLSFGSAWSQGFIEGSMVALLPVYLLAVGWTEGGVSWLLSAAMIGVILFQIPIASLADRLGRTRVLLTCYAVVIVTLGFLPHCLGAASLSVGLFLFAACSASFYPLGLALLGERVPPSGLARANAWYLAINCLGSLLGPAIAGYAMDELGRSALFGVSIIVVALVLLAWITLQLLGFHHASRGIAPVALFPETRNHEAA